MSGRWKIIFYFLAGAMGGLGSWAFVLFLLNKDFLNPLTSHIILGAVVGLHIGSYIWSVEAIVARQRYQAVRGAIYGGISGVIGGGIGGLFGATIFIVIGEFVVERMTALSEIGVYLGLAMGWGLLGLFIGMSGGLAERSWKKVLYGVVGGSIGGIAGGTIFNLLRSNINYSATAIGLALLGGFIGLGISLVEEAFAAVKIKIIKGRNEGREFVVAKNLISIGRDDRCDVCLSGNEGVALQHAKIIVNNKAFEIQETGGGTGVYVNDRKISSGELKNGDVIRMGSAILLFNHYRQKEAILKKEDAGSNASAYKKIVLKGLILITALIITSAPALAEEIRPVITQFDLSGYPKVDAYVAVLDKDGRPIKDIPLSRGKWQINENGAAYEPINIERVKAAGAKKNISVMLILDRSGSMKGEKMEKAKGSFLEFINLMEPEDKAGIIVFDDKVDFISELTSDKELLRQKAAEIKIGGNTAMFDALYAAIEKMASAPGRKAVIILTDGKSNRGMHTFSDTVEYASMHNMSIYTIGLGKDVKEDQLKRLADESGGEYFFTPTPERLVAFYETIGTQLKNEYIVTFFTLKKGEYLRNVQLSVEYKGERLFAGRRYFQPESTLFGSPGRPSLLLFFAPVAAVGSLLSLSLMRQEKVYKKAHISVLQGRSKATDFILSDSAGIGRDERNEIAIFKDEGVAQYHAIIKRSDDGYIIEDKSSELGTSLNHQMIAAPSSLKDGDVIGVGKAKLIFRYSEKAQKKNIELDRCPACNGIIRKAGKFCPNCGKRL
ncbi:MAG: VWA domain-containing protein [Nitrospirae bacterium]|nr:VWA domain-containing protein [Nitrospirota bacterium]